MYINVENTQSNILFIDNYIWLKSIKNPERINTKFMAGTGLSTPGDQTEYYLCHNVLLFKNIFTSLKTILSGIISIVR